MRSVYEQIVATRRAVHQQDEMNGIVRVSNLLATQKKCTIKVFGIWCYLSGGYEACRSRIFGHNETKIADLWRVSLETIEQSTLECGPSHLAIVALFAWPADVTTAVSTSSW